MQNNSLAEHRNPVWDVRRKVSDELILFQSGRFLFVLTPTQLAFQDYSMVPWIDGHIERLAAGEGIELLGLNRRVIPLDKLKKVTFVQEHNSIRIQWWQGIVPRDEHMHVQQGVPANLLFEELKTMWAGRLVEEEKMANLMDYPADARFAIAALVSFVGGLALYIGAFTNEMPGPRDKFWAVWLQQLGRWIGPIGVSAIGVVVLLSGLVWLIKMLWSQPMKKVLKPIEGLTVIAK